MVGRCSATFVFDNPGLNLSGGVNGAILNATGPKIQEELHSFLKQKGTSAVPAGTVVPTEAGSLPFRCILHAVAIDPFYDSSVQLIRRTVKVMAERAWWPRPS
uniref:macro domain-containing protein n=1 Tax=Stieleria neptunia TaxID=2527979 RepID=UPI00119D4167